MLSLFLGRALLLFLFFEFTISHSSGEFYYGKNNINFLASYVKIPVSVKNWKARWKGVRT